MLAKYSPTSLRGYLERDKYFEGWFQKVYSTKHKVSFIVIYGYATKNSFDKFGFIQILIPNKTPSIFYFSKNEISCDPTRHLIKMGDNVLSRKLIRIKNEYNDIHLNLTDNYPIKTFKNSMGYSYYIPYIPCYHSVINASHTVSGMVKSKDAEYSLDNETGYLEKNWGTSFPENYFWVHAIDPNNPQISLLFSKAEIVWLGKKFTRHVGHLRLNDKQIDLREFKNITFTGIAGSSQSQIIQISSHSISLEISFKLGSGVMLKGPKNGELSKDIFHQTEAFIYVSLRQKNKTQSFQMVGNIENVGIF